MRKLLAMLTVMVMLIISVNITVSAAIKFSDVGDYWATEAIKWAAEKGIVEGYPDGTFKPEKHVTEAEFVAILARYVQNTDKQKIAERQPGKHWAQSIYDELRRWDLPLKGYNNDKIKDSAITRGDVARVIAAKNGFNLDERQAVYYMYENDLSNGMIPNRLTFDSYGVNQPLQRDQITQFMKLLSSKGYTTFLGEPSPKGNAGPTDMLGIEDVPKSDAKITDDMFDELAKKKGITNPSQAQQQWERLAKSGGITSEEQITPEILEIVRVKAIGFQRNDWTLLSDEDFESYKKLILHELRNVEKIDGPIVISKDLFYETKDWAKDKRFIVIVNGRESWHVAVGITGNEHRVYNVGLLFEDIFKR